jgi:class 3 adenylate cyclase
MSPNVASHRDDIWAPEQAFITLYLLLNIFLNVDSAFDDKIDKYDVYKVETIGDAYMVASGLPERNGNKHVDEISRMALDLVKMTESFELTEVPGETLLIRVGIHTGR